MSTHCPKMCTGMIARVRGPIASADIVDRGDHVWIVAGLVPPDALAAVEPELR